MKAQSKRLPNMNTLPIRKVEKAEKKDAILFTRVKTVNKDYFVKQAKNHDMTESEFMDQLLDAARDEGSRG